MNCMFIGMFFYLLVLKHPLFANPKALSAASGIVKPVLNRKQRIMRKPSFMNNFYNDNILFLKMRSYI